MIMYFNTECLNYSQGVCIYTQDWQYRRLWDTRLTCKSYIIQINKNNIPEIMYCIVKNFDREKS